MTTTLLSYLRQLHLLAGGPSARSIARAIGTVSHTTVSDMLRSAKGRWPTVAKVVTHLDGDLEAAKALWANEHLSGAAGAFAGAAEDYELERHQTAVIVLVSSQGVDVFDAQNISCGVLDLVLRGHEMTVNGGDITVKVRNQLRTITIQDVRALHTIQTRPSR